MSELNNEQPAPQAESQHDGADASGGPDPLDEKLSAFRDSLLSSVQSMLQGMAPKAPEAKAPAPRDGQHADLVKQAEDAAARRYQFERQVESLAPQAQEMLRTLYDKEKPSNVSEWVNTYTNAFGIKRGNMGAGGNGSMPVTNGGVPKQDRALANYNKSFTDQSTEDVQELIRQHGRVGAGQKLREMARRDLAGVKLEFKRK